MVSQTEKLSNFKGLVRAAAGTETATQSGTSKTGRCSYSCLEIVPEEFRLSCILRLGHLSENPLSFLW